MLTLTKYFSDALPQLYDPNHEARARSSAAAQRDELQGIDQNVAMAIASSSVYGMAGGGGGGGGGDTGYDSPNKVSFKLIASLRINLTNRCWFFCCSLKKTTDVALEKFYKYLHKFNFANIIKPQNNMQSLMFPWNISDNSTIIIIHHWSYTNG